MHEFSIMSYLLEAVGQEAQKLGARRVTAINLAVGERAGIDDSLLFYFDMLTPETVAEGAQLNIRRTGMAFACDECDDSYAPHGSDFACPRCGQVGHVVNDGSELLIESIEIET
jgi:hydrogenase nickel incorporation protein HypA/HybF